MRTLLLAVALALGIGFAATGAQAMTAGSNLSVLQSVAKNGNAVVEKAYYRRHWRHRYYWRHNRHHRWYGRHHRRYWR